MKIKMVILLLQCFMSGCYLNHKNSHDSSSILLQNLNVINVVDKSICWYCDVLITNGRISKIARNQDQGVVAHKINYAGAYAIPGLYDAHVHIDTDNRLKMMLPEFSTLTLSIDDIKNDIKPYMNHGITGIVVLEGNQDVLKVKYAAESTNEFLPRVISSSPILDGKDAKASVYKKIGSVQAGVQAVSDAIADGYDLIKIYGNLNPGIRKAIIKEANAKDIPITAHLPTGEQFVDTIPGLNNLPHAEEIIRMWDGEDIDYIENALRLMVENKVSLTPNLIAYREIISQITSIESHLKNKNMDLVPPVSVIYSTPPHNGYVNDFSEKHINFFKKQTRVMDQLTFRAYELGIPILAGSDTGNPTMFAGQALYAELGLLTDLGLDPYDVIAAATINVAQFIGQEHDRGTIAAGKYADMVIMNVNPVTKGYKFDRQNILAVIKAGVIFDQARIKTESVNIKKNYAQRMEEYIKIE